MLLFEELLCLLYFVLLLLSALLFVISCWLDFASHFMLLLRAALIGFFPLVNSAVGTCPSCLPCLCPCPIPLLTLFFMLFSYYFCFSLFISCRFLLAFTCMATKVNFKFVATYMKVIYANIPKILPKHTFTYSFYLQKLYASVLSVSIAQLTTNLCVCYCILLYNM